MNVPSPDLSLPDGGWTNDRQIVRRFLAWARRADASGRADAASALARAYLNSDLAPDMRAEAELGLTAMLDDPSLLVRRALAEALAEARQAPHHLIRALACDQSEVAAVVLARTRVLGDDELVECAVSSDESAQIALARRAPVSGALAAALASTAARLAVLALVDNIAADMSTAARIVVDRFGENAEIREALLARSDIPAPLRLSLLDATAAALTRFVVEAGWMRPERASNVTSEESERGALTIAADCDGRELIDCVARLRRAGRLTAALLMRSLLCDEVEFLAFALAELSGKPPARALAVVKGGRSRALAALFENAGLPRAVHPAFETALGHALRPDATPGERVRRQTAAAVAEVCALSPHLSKMLAYVRKLDAEAARRAAREMGFEVRPDLAAALLDPLDLVKALHSVATEEPEIEDVEEEEFWAPQVELPLDLIDRLETAA